MTTSKGASSPAPSSGTKVTTSMDEREYILVKRNIRELLEINLDDYKSRQMQRRLKAQLARSGFRTWQRYFSHLKEDPEALQAFKNYLTINVSEFFRDPHKWEHLASKVLPPMLKNGARLRIWSAGCSHGAEPYTLAMLLDDLSSSPNHHRILATDIDRAMLDRAREGGPYTADDVRHVAKRRLARCFERKDDGYWVKPFLRTRVSFRQHNLLEDAFEKRFDLIVCRNVVIYFVEETKRMLYRQFAESLRTGGVLFVGGTEIISSLSELPLQSIAISFYGKKE